MEADMVRTTLRLWASLACAWALWLPLTGCGSSENAGTPVTTSIGGGETAAPQSKAPAERVNPAVRFETTQGAFTVELDQQHAPLTVENFLSYVESGHYNQTIFHQVVDGYIVLGGGFTAEYLEKPAQTTIRNEAHNGLSNKRGTIAMARQAEVIDSSTCQFFINLGENASVLDHKGRTAEDYGYCVFGHVAEGLDVVERIGKTPVRDVQDFVSTPTQAVVIKSARRVR
jgi:cyclophilin family peptidyl-prolyl cis-trans isomerase